MKNLIPPARIIPFAICASLLLALPSPAATEPDPRDDASPWGVGSGAEWAKEYPRFNPMLASAGVKWVRLFTEWHVVQPTQGEWHWENEDGIVANARRNNLHVIGGWAFFAKWASADGGTRKGPIKDMQYWRDYVSASVTRYKKDIKYWEVWNEFNGSFYQGKDKVKDYADLVVAAYDAAKKADPDCRVGMSVASSDIGFLDRVIKAGAANHFDFICIHPYENIGAVAYGDEVGYLGLGSTLRQMLAANKQPTDTPLWITEIGGQVPVQPDPQADVKQAVVLAKSYLLSLAQGFQRIFWFEARGPAYGKGTDYGIIRADWSTRPSYDCLKTMTTLLGSNPKYAGWLDIGKGGYGFMFSGGKENVLAAWAPLGSDRKVTFPGDVSVTDLEGRESTIPAGRELTLTNTPLFITTLPPDLTAQARANANQPFPWGGNYANASVVSCRLGDPNVDSGLKQVFLRPAHENHTVPATVDGAQCRHVVSKDNDNAIAYFRVDPQFVPYGPHALDITVAARRSAPDKPANLAITYETAKDLRNFKTGGDRWEIPAGDGWHEHTWHVTDACLAYRWGWNIGLISPDDTQDFVIKEVRVAKSK